MATKLKERKRTIWFHSTGQYNESLHHHHPHRHATCMSHDHRHDHHQIVDTDAYKDTDTNTEEDAETVASSRVVIRLLRPSDQTA